MRRGWIIRGFFVGVLMLCAGGWVASYIHPFVKVWWLSFVPYLQIEVANGGVHVIYEGHSPFIEIDAPYDWRFGKRLLGFNVQASHTRTYGLELMMDMPLWFPIVFSGLILLLVWRKTRKRTSGGAFPVVQGASTEPAR